MHMIWYWLYDFVLWVCQTFLNFFFVLNKSGNVSFFFFFSFPRYGSLFRTNFVGRNVVVSTDPEINHFIFQQEGTSFLISYTESFNEIFGQQSLLSYHGMLHKYLRNLILQLVGPENLKGKLMYEINEATRRHLHSWARHGTVDIKEVTSEVNHLHSYWES